METDEREAKTRASRRGSRRSNWRAWDLKELRTRPFPTAVICLIDMCYERLHAIFFFSSSLRRRAGASCACGRVQQVHITIRRMRARATGGACSSSMRRRSRQARAGVRTRANVRMSERYPNYCWHAVFMIARQGYWQHCSTNPCPPFGSLISILRDLIKFYHFCPPFAFFFLDITTVWLPL
jgi:hypothetical protein